MDLTNKFREEVEQKDKIITNNMLKQKYYVIEIVVLQTPNNLYTFKKLVLVIKLAFCSIPFLTPHCHNNIILCTWYIHDKP